MLIEPRKTNGALSGMRAPKQIPGLVRAFRRRTRVRRELGRDCRSRRAVATSSDGWPVPSAGARGSGTGLGPMQEPAATVYRRGGRPPSMMRQVRRKFTNRTFLGRAHEQATRQANGSLWREAVIPARDCWGMDCISARQSGFFGNSRCLEISHSPHSEGKSPTSTACI